MRSARRSLRKYRRAHPPSNVSQQKRVGLTVPNIIRWSTLLFIPPILIILFFAITLRGGIDNYFQGFSTWYTSFSRRLYLIPSSPLHIYSYPPLPFSIHQTLPNETITIVIARTMSLKEVENVYKDFIHIDSLIRNRQTQNLTHHFHIIWIAFTHEILSLAHCSFLMNHTDVEQNIKDHVYTSFNRTIQTPDPRFLRFFLFSRCANCEKTGKKLPLFF